MRRKVLGLWPPIWAKRAGGFQESKSFTGAPEYAHAEIAQQQRLLAGRINSLERTPSLTFQGRGIVLVIGGRYLATGWVLLSILRRVHRCQLPVEIWHLGDADFPPHLRALFDIFDVSFVDASRDRRVVGSRPTTGWELKPLAITLSPFADVLYLDADNLPVVDPATLFDDPRFRSTGAFFWPDIRKVNRFNPIWSIAGTTAPDGSEFESGLVLIDKLRHWPELQLTMHFNEQAHFYYRYLLGDKDTFQLAWQLLDGRFAMPRVAAKRAFGRHDADSDGMSRLVGMWQHDFDGNAIALHHTDTEPVAWGRNPRVPGFNLYEACDAALEELRLHWDGNISPVPGPHLVSAKAHEIATIRWFLYARPGLEPRHLEFLSDGHIGVGATGAERFWRLEGDGRDRQLVLSSREEDTCILRIQQDGSWRGNWLRFEQFPSQLIPLEGVEHEPSIPETDRRPKLLYITPVAPAESGNGLAMRAANVLRLLAETNRVYVLIVPLYQGGPATELLAWMETECEDVRWAHPTVAHTRETVPEIDDEGWERAWVEEVGRAYRDETFDTIHVFRLATLRLVRLYLTRPAFQPARRQLDLDDVESRTHYRLAALYARYSREAERSEAERLARRATDSERKLLTSWDRIFVCSEDDKADLEERLPNHRAELVVLPNRVRLPDNTVSPPRVAPLTLLYVGTLSYFPNADGVIWFCREVLPLIRELSAIHLRLLVVGTGATDEIRDLAHIPEVEVVGEVERVDEWYRSADLVVIPLRAGGGTRIKLIEAFAHRRPVVSTSIAAEGLAVVDEMHLLIGDRPEVFARHCLRLLQDAALAAQLAENGRGLVEECYALPAIEPAVTRVR